MYDMSRVDDNYEKYNEAHPEESSDSGGCSGLGCALVIIAGAIAYNFSRILDIFEVWIKTH